jgi:hypothetical protein
VEAAIQHFNATTNELQAKIGQAQNRWLDLDAAEEVLQLQKDAQQLLTDVGVFEISLTRSREVDERAAFDFESKATEFENAANYHRDQAKMMFHFMLGTVVFAALVILGLFLDIWFWPLSLMGINLCRYKKHNFQGMSCGG